MAIENIPAIREDYPLFSWSDHQESFAALKQGAEVAGFKKETWNAIIDKLKAVLTEGGLSWDSANYTTAENAKITEAYGALSAAMFNAVRHNIDHPVPVGWRWANDSTFRGYVGREDFHGYSEYGAQSDLFYAEYLIEIVRKLNLLIEILRGTAPFADFESKYNIESLYDVNLLAKPSVPLVVSENAQSVADCNLLSRPSAPMEFSENITSKTAADIVAIRSQPMDSKELMKTWHRANMDSQRSQSLGGAFALSGTKSAVSISSARIQEIFAAAKSNSLHRAEADVLPSASMGAESRSNTLESVQLTKGQSAPMDAAECAKSSEKALIELAPPLALTATETAQTKQSATLGKALAKPMGAVALSASISSATLDFAWIPPIRTGNNLYIRQVYDMERNGNDLRLI